MTKLTITDHSGNDREINLDDLFKATLPRVKCSNSCNHGCSIEVPEDGNWPTAAIRNGWIVQVWRTPYAEHVGDHVVLFCDPICCYEHMRKRLRETARMGERISHICAEHDLQFSPDPKYPALQPHLAWLEHMMNAHKTIPGFSTEPDMAGAEGANGLVVPVSASCGPYCDGIGSPDDDLVTANPDLPGISGVPFVAQSIDEALERAWWQQEHRDA